MTDIKLTTRRRFRVRRDGQIPLGQQIISKSGSSSTGGSSNSNTPNIDVSDYANLTKANIFKDINTFEKDILIKGNIIQQGQHYITKAENIEVKSNLLHLNDGEVGSTITGKIPGTDTLFSGIAVGRGSGDPYYLGVVEGGKPLLKLGKKDSLEAIATRADSITNGHAIEWDGTNKRMIGVAAVRDSLKLGGVSPENYARTDVSETFKSRLTIDYSATGGNGTWDKSGILIKNNHDATAEVAVAYQNKATANNYWITGLNQGSGYSLAYGSSYTDDVRKWWIDTNGNTWQTGDLEVSGTVISESGIRIGRNEVSLTGKCTSGSYGNLITMGSDNYAQIANSTITEGVKLYSKGNKLKFQTTSTGTKTTGDNETTGVNTAYKFRGQNIEFGKDSTGYLINKVGVAYIKNEADNEALYIRSRTDGVDYHAFRAYNKAACLYYDNTIKFSTTDYGTSTNGNHLTTGYLYSLSDLYVNGVSYLRRNEHKQLRLRPLNTVDKNVFVSFYRGHNQDRSGFLQASDGYMQLHAELGYLKLRGYSSVKLFQNTDLKFETTNDGTKTHGLQSASRLKLTTIGTTRGQVTATSSIDLGSTSTYAYGISNNVSGGLDIMANQSGQAIRLYSGGTPTTPILSALFRGDGEVNLQYNGISRLVTTDEGAKTKGNHHIIGISYASNGFQTDSTNGNYTLITRTGSTSSALYVQKDTVESGSNYIASFNYGSTTAGSGVTVMSIRSTSINTYKPSIFSDYADFGKSIYLRSNINIRNKVNDNWVSFATRNTSGSEAVLDLQNIGDLRAKGYVGSDSYVSGITGYGWRISNTANGELSNLDIRESLTCNTFTNNKINISNGDLIVSDHDEVEKVVASGSTHTNFYFSKEQPFQAGDILCCRGSKQAGNVKVYYVTIAEVGTSGSHKDEDGEYMKYVRWLNTTKTGTGTPEIGDVLVRWNSSDEARKGLLYMSSSSTYSPFYDVVYDSKTVSRFGKLEGITSPTFGNLDGYGFWAENGYLEGGINATFGKIGGWDIYSNRINSDNYSVCIQSSSLSDRSAANRLLIGNWTDTRPTVRITGGSSSQYVELMNNSSSSWGLRGTDTSGNTVISLGSSNQIANWQIEKDFLYSGDKFTFSTSHTSGLTLKSGATPYSIVHKSRYEYVRMYYNSSDDWGLRGVAGSGNEIFSLGSKNQIANWDFDKYSLQNEVDTKYLILSNREGYVVNSGDRGRRGLTFYQDNGSTPNGGVKIIQMGELPDKDNTNTWHTTGNYGFRIGRLKDNHYRDIFRADKDGAFIAGWSFNDTQIYNGNMYLHKTGGIYAHKSGGNYWHLNNDGSGQLASNNISWDASGNVTFSPKVRLQWQSNNLVKIPWNYESWGNAHTMTYGSEIFGYYSNSANNAVVNDLTNYDTHRGRHNRWTWMTRGTGIDSWNGGMTVNLNVDTSQSYMFVQWVKTVNPGATASGSARVYWGLDGGCVENLASGTDNTNPYFCYPSGTDIDDDWYLFVGVVYSKGSSNNGDYLFTGGIYNTKGKKIGSCIPYKWRDSSGSTDNMYTRTGYYRSDKGYMFIQEPQAYIMDGNQPSINDLLNNVVNSTYIDGSGIYTGTLTANQVNTVGLNASSITTGTVNTNRLDANTIKSQIVQTTDLDASKITTGTLSASLIASKSITADKINFDNATGNNVSLTGYINATSGKIGNFNISSGNLLLDTSAKIRVGNGSTFSINCLNESAQEEEVIKVVDYSLVEIKAQLETGWLDSTKLHENGVSLADKYAAKSHNHDGVYAPKSHSHNYNPTIGTSVTVNCTGRQIIDSLTFSNGVLNGFGYRNLNASDVNAMLSGVTFETNKITANGLIKGDTFSGKVYNCTGSGTKYLPTGYTYYKMTLSGNCDVYLPTTSGVENGTEITIFTTNNYNAYVRGGSGRLFNDSTSQEYSLDDSTNNIKLVKYGSSWYQCSGTR